MKIIAHIENQFSEKFGIPRQSMLVEDVMSTIIFEPEYRNPDALRGLDGFDYIWLLWKFENVGVVDITPKVSSETSATDSSSESDSSSKVSWSPTVRPPRLGGNERMGVFATRSPFRPNSIGLSCVKIIEIGTGNCGPYIKVAGADLMNGTKIYDIKPYLPYADSHPDARGGFASEHYGKSLNVVYSEDTICILPKEHRDAVIKLLSQDPRPSYHHDKTRSYGMTYAGYNIKFCVDDDVDTLTISNITRIN